MADRLDELHDEPRPGAPRTIGDDAVEAVVVKTLEETPIDATHWSTRSMAKATGMSQSAVSRIWRAFGLKPHLVETFKLSPEPLFVEKVRDIVGLYVNPPDAALVLCVDEKTQIQALDRTSPVLPLRPGLPERRTTAPPRNSAGRSIRKLWVGLSATTRKMAKPINAERQREKAENAFCATLIRLQGGVCSGR